MNTLSTLLLVCVLSSALALAVPRMDKALVWCVGISLTLAAGLRTDGFDYDEYLDIINVARSLADDDLLVRIVAAKDPLFLIFIDAAGTFSEDPRAIFMLLTAAGVACKVIAVYSLPRRRTLFISLYTLFLSPGLEFAAIRTGLAVGLAMLALATAWRWRGAWMWLAIASHLSLLVVAIGRLMAKHRALVLVLLLAATPVLAPWLLSFGVDDQRFFQYFENPGTAAALFLPVVTLSAWIPLAVAARSSAPSQPLLAPEARIASSFSIAVAIVLALPSVTVSFRTLEIAWVLIVAQVIAISSQRLHKTNQLRLAAGAGLMLAALSFSNIARSTWAAMVDMHY